MYKFIHTLKYICIYIHIHAHNHKLHLGFEGGFNPSRVNTQSHLHRLIIISCLPERKGNSEIPSEREKKM